MVDDTPQLHIDETVSSSDDDHDDTVVASADDRHLKRVALMQSLFAYSFEDLDQGFQDQFAADEELQAIIADIPTLDQEIQAAAPERPLEEINKVDLAILRLSVFESKHKKTPKKVLINEAIELAKEFGTESSSRFVNGVLANVFAM